MAKILDSSVNPVYTERVKRVMPTNRAEQELNIALNAKKTLDSFFTYLNDAPSEISNYYKIDQGETTFSNNLNLQRDSTKSNSFHKILNLVVFGQKAEKELTKRDDDERSVAYVQEEQERIIPQGSIRPVVGDHLEILSQSTNVRKLYMITNVDIQKLVDKPIYLITISPSTTFDITSIQFNVTRTFNFVFGNIGTGRKTIIEDTILKRVEDISATLVDLNAMYVNTFYSEDYDILRYIGKGIKHIFVSCKALREFQNDFGILRYGSDLNTLFTSYPIESDDNLKDYKLSYINRILKRKVPLKNETMSPRLGDINPKIASKPNDLTFTFQLDFNNRDVLNEEAELLADMDEFTPKYDFSSIFYTNTLEEFNIMTNFRKSNIVLYELNSRPRNILNKDNEYFMKYEPTSKILMYFLEKYLDKDYDAILNTDILDDYVPSNNNIDDYLLLPVVIYVITEAINEIEKDEVTISF